MGPHRGGIDARERHRRRRRSVAGLPVPLPIPKRSGTSAAGQDGGSHPPAAWTRLQASNTWHPVADPSCGPVPTSSSHPVMDSVTVSAPHGASPRDAQPLYFPWFFEHFVAECPSRPSCPSQATTRTFQRCSRFSEENIDSIRPYTYLPFGAVPRNCIGKSFALEAVKQSLLHSVHSVEFDPRGISSKIPKRFGISEAMRGGACAASSTARWRWRRLWREWPINEYIKQVDFH
ncbi:hypothetical protein HPB47_017189 [Ixodes persulcatus]|uniref:Uncharacterized protein n=1 Tax=Ixodes persulcatus TaxID=34615 RepID=A0AC60R0E7_IXOPE|nr:hypothetical protein HPB47_017189 [Ixodes persulcatus]